MTDLILGIPEPKMASLGTKSVSESLRDIQDVERALNSVGYTLTIGTLVDDTAYSASWNGDTGKAPSKNAVYDKINGMSSGATVQTFTSSGTWTKPSSGTMAYVELWGGGGSGGYASTKTGGGGGGCEYVGVLILLSDCGATESVTIGAGGAEVSSSSNGHQGGETTFGSLLTAHGGYPGYSNGYGGKGGRYSDVFPGQTFAIGAGGVVSGASGYDTVRNGTFGVSGIGGGGGASSSDTSYHGGNGGAAEFGGGGGSGASPGTGSSGPGSGGISKYSGAGGSGAYFDGGASAGSAPGGGGGGGGDGMHSGAGADGKIRVVVF